ncbi:MAG: 23S rRNA (guanosine(2251)-2'-O)-methyltransferase RlmB [Clostridia bacterium]|nr:23S rRNA (guanosine(2251)-2'-O)-methyltransferase RlmB [Clostridia bacterium]
MQIERKRGGSKPKSSGRMSGKEIRRERAETRGRGAREEKQGRRDFAKSERKPREEFRREFKEERRAPREAVDNPNLLIGRNPINEAIKAGRPIDKILMQKDIQGSGKAIGSLARENGIQIQYVDKIVLDKLAPGRPHQGLAAYVAAHEYVDIDYIIDCAKKKGEDPLIVVLDGLEDPHNLGAILRSCDGAGAHGVIIPSRRSVSLTETVAKASAGAIEYVPVAKTGNLSQTLELLKKRGLWIASVDMDGENYSSASLSGPLAIVIGGEGAGVSRNVKEHSDFVVSIPMKGKVNSLNASNAAAIVLYEAARQRDNG